MVLTSGLLLVLAQAPNDIDVDFRGAKFPRALLKYSGVNADNFVQREPEGLRIRIPALEKPIPQVGIALNPIVDGDFEITVQYAILWAGKPDAGYGLGVNLAIAAETPTKDVAVLARRVNLNGKVVYAHNRAFTPKDGDTENDVRFTRTEASRGRLRMTRTGSELVFSAAEEESNEFKQLRQVTFVAAPLKSVRVVADQGKSHQEIDVMLERLQIRSGALASTMPPPATGSGGWVWIWVLLAGGLLVGSGVGYVVWQRMLKSPGDTLPSQKMAGKKGAGSTRRGGTQRQ
jgi:hypothetical protein